MKIYVIPNRSSSKYFNTKMERLSNDRQQKSNL